MSVTLEQLGELIESQRATELAVLERDRQVGGIKARLAYLVGINGGADASGPGWSINVKTGDVLVANNADTNSFNQFMDAHLSHHEWYTKIEDVLQRMNSADYEGPDLPPGWTTFPGAEVKLLGREVNPAVDIEIIVREVDAAGSFLQLKVLNVKRWDTGQKAFIGGMIEPDDDKGVAGLVDRSVSELLQEIFSGNMWDDQSPLFSTFKSRVPEVLTALEKILTTEKVFASIGKYADSLITAFKSTRDLSRAFSAFREAAFRLQGQPVVGGKPGQVISKESAQDVWTDIKIALYKVLCPDQFLAFYTFFKDKMTALPRVTVAADFRNTRLGYMVSYPFYVETTSAELQDLEKHCLLRKASNTSELRSGGGDTTKASVDPIESMFGLDAKGNNAAFASHSSMLLHTIRQMCISEPSLLSEPGFIKQIEVIRAKIEGAQKEVLGVKAAHTSATATSAATPLLLQGGGVSPGSLGNIPVLSTAAAIQTFSEVSHEPIAPDQLTSAARDNLRSIIGQARLDQMEKDISSRKLPFSLLTLLEVLQRYSIKKNGKVVLVLDNSGSMTGEMEYTVENEGKPTETVRTTRWKELAQRLTSDIPLLAAAGCAIELQLINPSASRIAQEVFGKVHDFSVQDLVANLGDSVQEQAKTSAKLSALLSHLNRFFSTESPAGRTDLLPVLDPIFAKTVRDGSQQLVILITDGLPTDSIGVLEVARRIETRSNPSSCPIIIQSCLDARNKQEVDTARWAAGLAKNPMNYVSVVDILPVEQKQMTAMQGPLIPMSVPLYYALAITPPMPFEEAKTCGGFLLFPHFRDGRQFSQEELSSFFGHQVSDATYQMYLSTKPFIGTAPTNATTTTTATGMSRGATTTATPSQPFNGANASSHQSHAPSFASQTQHTMFSTTTTSTPTVYLSYSERMRILATQSNPALTSIKESITRVQNLLARLAPITLNPTDAAHRAAIKDGITVIESFSNDQLITIAAIPGDLTDMERGLTTILNRVAPTSMATSSSSMFGASRSSGAGGSGASSFTSSKQSNP